MAGKAPEDRAERGKRLALTRSNARLAAVQALYQWEATGTRWLSESACGMGVSPASYTFVLDCVDNDVKIFDPAGRWPDAMKGGYTASGAFGQFITVLPKLDLVVAHKTQAPSTLNVPPERYLGEVVPAVMELVN